MHLRYLLGKQDHNFIYIRTPAVKILKCRTGQALDANLEEVSRVVAREAEENMKLETVWERQTTNNELKE